MNHSINCKDSIRAVDLLVSCVAEATFVTDHPGDPQDEA